MKPKTEAKELLKMLTDGLDACKAGFQTVEGHENTLDQRITILEERIICLEKEVREAGIEPTNPCGK